MKFSSLSKEIIDIQKNFRPQRDLSDDPHERLFEIFQEIEAAIAERPTGDDDADANASGLIEAQSVVIRTAAALPARCTRDLLFKLALWRWDAPDLEQPVEDMNRADAIAYSAFIDLSKMLGAQEVLKEFDKASQR